MSDSSSISLVRRRIMINVDGSYHKFRATKSETRSATRVLSALHCCAMHHGFSELKQSGWGVEKSKSQSLTKLRFDRIVDPRSHQSVFKNFHGK